MSQERTLGQILSQLVCDSGVSRQQLASEADITRRNLVRILHDRGAPLLYTLGLILKALGASQEITDMAIVTAGYPGNNTVGGAVARLIVKKCMQFKELSAASGVSLNVFNRVVWNRARLHRFTLERILKALRASPEEQERILRLGGYTGPKNPEFGKLCLDLRTLRGMLQKEVAQRTGLKPYNLARWEKGQVRRPNLKTLELFIAVLKPCPQTERSLRQAALGTPQQRTEASLVKGPLPFYLQALTVVFALI